jgi:predicted ester cyclase
MSTSKNKEIVTRFTEEVLNKGDYSKISEYVTPEHFFHFGEGYKGPDGMRQVAETMRKAFPDFHADIKHIIAEGDMVATFYRMMGTFSGQLKIMGISFAPTGKKMDLPFAVLSLMKDGKQVEAWSYYDQLEMFRQLGIKMPEAQPVGAR